MVEVTVVMTWLRCGGDGGDDVVEVVVLMLLMEVVMRWRWWR